MPETQVFETQFTAQPFVFSRPWGERSRIVLAANQAGSRRVPFFDLENARAGRGRIGRTSGLTVLLELTTMSRIAPSQTLKLPRIPRPGRPWKRSGRTAAGSPT